MAWMLQDIARDPHCRFCFTATGRGGEILSTLGGTMIPSTPTGDTGTWYERAGLFVNTNYTFNGGVATPAAYGTLSSLYTKFDMHGWSTDFTIIGCYDFPTLTGARYQLFQNGNISNLTRGPYLAITDGGMAGSLSDTGTHTISATHSVGMYGTHCVAMRLSNTGGTESQPVWLGITVDDVLGEGQWYSSTYATSEYNGTICNPTPSGDDHYFTIGRRNTTGGVNYALPFRGIMVFDRAMSNDEILTIMRILNPFMED